MKSRCSPVFRRSIRTSCRNAGSAGIAEKSLSHRRQRSRDDDQDSSTLREFGIFGLRTHVSDPEQAVASSVSIRSSRSSLSSQVFAQFEQGRLPSFSLEALWRHAMLTGTCARRIAKDAGASQQVIDEAFTAALLHDVGVLVLAANKRMTMRGCSI